MANLLNMTPAKTYATRENAIKAVTKLLPNGKVDSKGRALDYIIATNNEGRFFPAFLGERAIQAGIHFHFCVIG